MNLWGGRIDRKGLPVERFGLCIATLHVTQDAQKLQRPRIVRRPRQLAKKRMFGFNQRVPVDLFQCPLQNGRIRRADGDICCFAHGANLWMPSPKRKHAELATGMHMASFDGPVPGVPGAVVREVEHVPDHLARGIAVGPRMEAAEGAYLFEVPGIARYLVRDGAFIDVKVLPQADRSAARFFLHGAARGALIHQRGEIALGAVTLVAPNWKCVAIAAPSALGKSTIAAALCQRGWLLVADGVTRVTWNGSMAIAWPADDSIKLWRDACGMLSIEADRFPRVRDGIEKFQVGVPIADSPAALSAVVRLRVASGAGLTRFPPSECGQLLADCTYRSRLIGPLGHSREHARVLTQVASFCQPLGVGGARNLSIHELADRIAEAVR